MRLILSLCVLVLVSCNPKSEPETRGTRPPDEPPPCGPGTGRVCPIPEDSLGMTPRGAAPPTGRCDPTDSTSLRFCQDSTF